MSDYIDTLVEMGRNIAREMGDVSPIFFRVWAKRIQRDTLPEAMKILEFMASQHSSVSSETKHYSSKCLEALRRHEATLQSLDSRAISWVLGFAYRELCAINGETGA